MAEQGFSGQSAGNPGANGLPATASAAEIFVEAERLYDLGRLDEAIATYRQGLQKDPDNIVAVNNLAMVYIEKEDHAAAYEELFSATQRGARHAELFSNLGYVLRRMGRDSDAADAYDEYLKTCGNTEEATKIRGWIEKVRQENPQPAALAVEPSPTAPEPVAPLPQDEPVNTLPQPAEPNPPAASAPSEALSVNALLELAEQAYERESYDEAKARYDQVLDIDLQNAEALAGRGQSLAKLGLMEEALASLREAVQVQPNDAPTWYVLGFVLRALARNAEAADAFEQFISRMPQAENADKIRDWIQEVRATTAAPSPAPSAPAPTPQPPVVEPDSEELLLEKTAMALTPSQEAAEPQLSFSPDEPVVQPEAEATPAWAQAARNEEPPAVAPDAGAGMNIFANNSADDSGDGVDDISMAADDGLKPDPMLEKTIPEVAMFHSTPEVAAAGMMSALDAAFGPDDEEPESLSFDGPAMSDESAVVPDDPTPEQQLENAYAVMAKGDSTGAFEIARAICAQFPDHAEALLLAARCLGQMKRFQEAADYLKRLLDLGENDEALYLYGRCEEELGDPEAAMEFFKRCADCTADKELRESALAHVHDLSPVAENVLCPACGKRVAEEKLQQNDNNETMCEDCLRQYENKQKLAAIQPPRLPQKKKKRGCCFCCLGLVGIVVLLSILLGLILYLFPAMLFQPLIDAATANPTWRQSMAEATQERSEEEIQDLEANLKELGINVDLTGLRNGTFGKSREEKKRAEKKRIEYNVVAEQVVLFIPGVPNSTSFSISPEPPEGETINVSVNYSRESESPVEFDEETRTLRWQPALSDVAAGDLRITCQASIGRTQATEATIIFRLMALPTVEPLGVRVPPVPFDPGDATLLASGILDQSDQERVVVTTGRNLFGQLLVYGNTSGGWNEFSSLNLENRPIGLAVWNDATVVLVTTKAIRRFGWNTSESRFVPKGEMLEFPAEAALCAFGNPDGEGGPGLAVLIPQTKQIFVYESVGSDDLVQYQRIPLPEREGVWRQMQLGDLIAGDNGAEEVMLWSGGQKQPNLFVRNIMKGIDWETRVPGTGALVRAGWRSSKETGGELAAVIGAVNPMMQFIPVDKSGQRQVRPPIPIDNNELPVGFAFADLDGNGQKDLVVLLPDRIMLRFWTDETTSAQAPTIQLGADTAPLLGEACVMKLPSGHEAVVMVHRDGSLSTLQMPVLPQTAEEDQ